MVTKAQPPREIAPGVTFALVGLPEHARLLDYLHAKLHPVRPSGSGLAPAAGRWAPTASRWDVVLPPDAPDLMLDPKIMATLFDACARDDQRHVAAHLKWTVEPGASLAGTWERARAFAAAGIARGHGLAVVMALHDPSASGARQPAAAHVHLVVPVRKPSARGWGSYCTLVGRDQQAALQQAWTSSG